MYITHQKNHKKISYGPLTYYSSLKDFGTSGSKNITKQYVLAFFATLVKKFANAPIFTSPL